MEPNEAEKMIGDLEIAVDRLRSLYEQYFMGIERLEPTVPRKDVDRRIHILRKEQFRNTALRFRFQMLIQRYNTYQTHWQRICRDIENGTYKRHVVRAHKRFGIRRSSDRPASGTPTSPRSLAEQLAEIDKEFAPAETLDDMDVAWDDEPATLANPLQVEPRPNRSVRPPPSARPARVPPAPPSRPAPQASRPGPPSSRPAPKTPRAPAPPPAPPGVALGGAHPLQPDSAARAPKPPAPVSGPMPPRPVGPPPASRPAVVQRRDNDLPDDRVRQLYSQYVEARRRQNESTASITYDSVARSLRQSSAKLRQKLGRPVDFEVAVKDGRAILRPVVK